MPAEILRERPPPGSAGGAEPPEGKPPGLLAPESLVGFFDRALEAYRDVYGPGLAAITKAERAAGETRERVVRPAIERAQRATEAPLPPLPKTEPEPPVPPLRARPFLATEGRGNLEAVISGLGLIAQVFTGIAAKAPVAALGAVTGAMRGWAEGDQVRAERHWREYLGQVDAIRHENRQALALWEAAMQQYGAHTQAAEAGLTAALAEAGFDDHAVLVAERGMERSLAPLKEAERLSGELWNRTYQLEQLRVMEGWKAATLALKEREVAAKEKEAENVLAAYTPETLTALGQQWALTGRTPSVGMGKAGQVVKGKVVAAGIEWAKAQGIDPLSLPGIQAEVAGARSAYTKVTGQKALALANVGNFEKHMDNLVELGKKVDRTGSPVINRYQLWVRGQGVGDPEVATFDAQAYEVAMEFSKVMVGTAQGDAATRDEARKVINNALTQDQLEAVSRQLKVNAQNRIKAWDEAQQEQLAVIRSATGAPSPAAKGKVLVGPDNKRYDGTGLDPSKLQPGWRLE